MSGNEVKGGGRSGKAPRRRGHEHRLRRAGDRLPAIEGGAGRNGLLGLTAEYVRSGQSCPGSGRGQRVPLGCQSEGSGEQRLLRAVRQPREGPQDCHRGWAAPLLYSASRPLRAGQPARELGRQKVHQGGDRTGHDQTSGGPDGAPDQAASLLPAVDAVLKLIEEKVGGRKRGERAEDRAAAVEALVEPAAGGTGLEMPPQVCRQGQSCFPFLGQLVEIPFAVHAVRAWRRRRAAPSPD